MEQIRKYISANTMKMAMTIFGLMPSEFSGNLETDLLKALDQKHEPTSRYTDPDIAENDQQEYKELSPKEAQYIQRDGAIKALSAAEWVKYAEISPASEIVPSNVPRVGDSKPKQQILS